MVSLRNPKPTEWAQLRRAFEAYQQEIGVYGRRKPNHFDTFARKANHKIIVLDVNSSMAGFAFLRWGTFEGTELTEYWIEPGFRAQDIAFLGFKALVEEWPGRWQGVARETGKIAAFWKWSIRRLKGKITLEDRVGGEFFFAFEPK